MLGDLLGVTRLGATGEHGVDGVGNALLTGGICKESAEGVHLNGDGRDEIALLDQDPQAVVERDDFDVIDGDGLGFLFVFCECLGDLLQALGVVQINGFDRQRGVGVFVIADEYISGGLVAFLGFEQDGDEPVVDEDGFCCCCDVLAGDGFDGVGIVLVIVGITHATDIARQGVSQGVGALTTVGDTCGGLSFGAGKFFVGDTVGENLVDLLEDGSFDCFNGFGIVGVGDFAVGAKESFTPCEAQVECTDVGYQLLLVAHGLNQT